MTNTIVQTWEGSTSVNRRLSLPELLSRRQLCGKPSSSRTGNLSRRGIPLNLLSSRGAWNTRRMQNMILVVGPNTPASLLLGCAGCAPSMSSSSASSSASEASPMEETHEQLQEGLEGVQPEQEESPQIVAAAPPPSGRSRWLRDRNREERHGTPARDDNDNDDDDDEDQEDDEDDDEEDEERQLQAFENALMSYYQTDEEDSQASVEVNGVGSLPNPVPSMRHGGCINTAAWLNCGWRISVGAMSREAQGTEECTTQIVTSGDDLQVKFWDVSHAMGMASPLAGSYATICPFSAPEASRDVRPIRSNWKQRYANSDPSMMAGSVLNLATLSTGHTNNVFHVTPLYGQPGKVATCAADGFLRLADLETGNSRVVVSPEYDDDIGGLFRAGLMSLRPGMCFSHHFLSQNTGLLCSERGLRRFDLRLPPREQSTRSLLGGSYRGCKSCAVWSASKPTTSLEEGDSAYIFAGGSSAEVALCDLRMTDGISSKIIQKYCPRNLSLVDMISVSGLDVSKDGKELLVSYESDQIYTFPIFPRSSSAAGPTVDEISQLTDGQQNEVLPELACYGGHLNRFTFLKNAKYAGPRDEYICTGSDSGRAWIYEKTNGSVVSLLNADHSTCNGVIPHPSLPFFITYGIDPTAKLWRATVPVDGELDDSDEGRRNCTRREAYEMSPIVRDWHDVQKQLNKLDSEDIKQLIDVFPDQIPSPKDSNYRGRFGGRLLLREAAGGTRLGNDLHNLPRLLLKNFYDCVVGVIRDDSPVESGLHALKHRISLIRLRHQADKLGLHWGLSSSWKFDPPRKNASASTEKNCQDLHPADLVPDFPSDWIPYDPEMTENAWDLKDYFNTKDYVEYYMERYPELEYDERLCEMFDVLHEDEQDASTSSGQQILGVDESDKKSISCDAKGETSTTDQKSDRCPKQTVRSRIYETAKLLKDAGNLALWEEDLDLAARRYDKAIRFGAIATMKFPSKNHDTAITGGHRLEWDPLIRVIIASRLNLSLLMLKPHFSRYEQAAEQARLALHDLSPFCVAEGKVMKGSKLDKMHRDDEPEQTYLEAMSLQAKAYFRLGSAQYELGEYGKAISSFESSVRCTELARAKPDNLVLRRLNEAKRESRLKSKRQRKKFKFAFMTNENDESPSQPGSEH